MFGALFEYSVILLRLKIYSLQQGCDSNMIMSLAAASLRGAGVGGSSNGAPATSAQAAAASMKVARKNQMVTRFDLFCLVFFPVLFLIFMGIYWLSVMVL